MSIPVNKKLSGIIGIPQKIVVGPKGNYVTRYIGLIKFPDGEVGFISCDQPRLPGSKRFKGTRFDAIKKYIEELFGEKLPQCFIDTCDTPFFRIYSLCYKSPLTEVPGEIDIGEGCRIVWVSTDDLDINCAYQNAGANLGTPITEETRKYLRMVLKVFGLKNAV